MLISVDGPIGAGKSTLVHQLGKCFTVFEEPIKKWTLLEDFARQPSVHAFALQVEILISYYNMLKKISKEDIVIMERSAWSSNKVFFDMYIDCPEKRNVYDCMYNIYASEPDAILFLDIDEETSWKRVKQRGRAEESSYTENHVKNVVKKYKGVMKETTIPVYTLHDQHSLFNSAMSVIDGI